MPTRRSRHPCTRLAPGSSPDTTKGYRHRLDYRKHTQAGARVYFEVTTPAWEPMLDALRALPIVRTL